MSRRQRADLLWSLVASEVVAAAAADSSRPRQWESPWTVLMVDSWLMELLMGLLMGLAAGAGILMPRHKSHL